ncbi:MAG TPA: DinB family protein [Candidatus Acidoferrales bacterium]|nr:DinB family protein [Candidatus Acidoferrales bacterium]
MDEKTLREFLSKCLDWHEAHADWKQALAPLPLKQQGARPPGSAHSPWELLEHARIAQSDILEFCRDAKHVSPAWPEGYWPQSPAPPDSEAWAKSAKAFQADIRSLQDLVTDPKFELLAAISHGSGQTLLREILLVLDHNSYHLGQLVITRKLLGCWPEG